MTKLYLIMFLLFISISLCILNLYLKFLWFVALLFLSFLIFVIILSFIIKAVLCLLLNKQVSYWTFCVSLIENLKKTYYIHNKNLIGNHCNSDVFLMRIFYLQHLHCDTTVLRCHLKCSIRHLTQVTLHLTFLKEHWTK